MSYFSFSLITIIVSITAFPTGLLHFTFIFKLFVFEIKNKCRISNPAWNTFKSMKQKMTVAYKNHCHPCLPYINNSHSFRSEHTFLSARPAADNITGFTRRALCGHTETHLMQEMHALSSIFLGLSLSIAWTGHSFAHMPHCVHSLVGFGIMPTPPAFL